tara:strand:+ start:443 stop:853 length:411 start_codon:yes stop_codon:yes gene_type:complete
MTDKPEPNKEYALTGKSGDACIANGSSWKESEVKKKPETCNEQLERMVKNIALDITEGKPGTSYEYMEDVYNIEWITNQDHTYKAARLLVAGGGPNIWVNLQTNTVDGYWSSDQFSWGFQDAIGLDEYLQEMHEDR